MEKINVNMNLDPVLVKRAKEEAKNVKRTFSLFIEWLLEKYFTEKNV